MRGVILQATGWPIYGMYARDLIVGLRHRAPSIPIALIHEGNSLGDWDEEDKARVDYLIEAKPEWLHNEDGKRNDLKCKLFLNEVTPFNETLFLDVDMQLTNGKNLPDAFNELQGISFTIANRGIATGDIRTEWMPVSEGEKYGVSELYNVSSEWIYFEEAGKDVFRVAQNIYNENKLTVTPFDLDKPDEPYIAMAMAVLNIAPHQVPYTPTYWQPYHFNKFHSQEFMYNNHYAISGGGAANPKPIRDKINHLTGDSYYQLGISKNKMYGMQDKKTAMRSQKRRQDK